MFRLPFSSSSGNRSMLTPTAKGAQLQRLGQRKESEILKAVLQHLNLLPGVVAWRTNVGAFAGEYKGKKRFVRFGFTGLVDIIGWKTETHWDRPAPPGIGKYHVARFLAIEVKRPGEEPTPEQANFLELVGQSGGLAFVARSIDDVTQAMGVEPKSLKGLDPEFTGTESSAAYVKRRWHST